MSVPDGNTALRCAAMLLAATALALRAVGAAAQEPTLHDHPGDLQPVHPDESVETTLHDRFSLDRALGAAVSVRGALTSFEELTTEVRRRVPKRRLAEIGNTEPEMQTIGFHNLPGTLEGTLRLQDWTIKKLRWELAVERRNDGRATELQVRELRQTFDAADEAFRRFWREFGIAD
jgi:uncharacterized protein with von Willebrand factor type A (vWA) domain